LFINIIFFYIFQLAVFIYTVRIRNKCSRQNVDQVLMYHDTFFFWLLLISLLLSLSTLLMEPNISLLLHAFLASTPFFSSRTKQSFVYVSIRPIIVAKTSVFFLLFRNFTLHTFFYTLFSPTQFPHRPTS